MLAQMELFFDRRAGPAPMPAEPTGDRAWRAVFSASLAGAVGVPWPAPPPPKTGAGRPTIAVCYREALYGWLRVVVDRADQGAPVPDFLPSAEPPCMVAAWHGHFVTDATRIM